MLIPSTAVESMGLGGMLGRRPCGSRLLSQADTASAPLNGPVV